MAVREATIETVWTTVLDELDVPYVVRFDVR